MSGEAGLQGEAESVLSELVEKLTAELRAGRNPRVEEVARDHPELIEDLRQIWSAVIVTEELARWGSSVFEPTGPVVPDADPPLDPARAEPPDLESFGDYEILEELGRGGMGIVYKAKQTSLDRTVALKVLLGGAMASRTDTARFRSEAQAAASLDHAHIVSVYEVGEHEGQPYFTMQYISGVTLAQRLTRGPLGSREAATLLIPVCRAIQYAHAHGVLHRDLKPSNILIDAHGLGYVADFGLAKRVTNDSSLTQSGAIIGSPCYMAPEQAAGHRGQIDATTDVYGLGAVLYHTVTGRPPFQEASPIDPVLSVLEEDPPAPRLIQPQVDRDLEMIALKCLQKPQDLRYRGARELAADLDAYLGGELIAARSTGILQVASRVFRETHHADVLENWGLLWMLHSLALVALCGVTNYFQLSGIESSGPYILLWTLGLGSWAIVFWTLRRRGGPITFVERQIAHLWGAAILSSILLFVIEILLDLPVLTLSPVLALISGSVFLVKGGILSGMFYIQAGGLFITSGVMALVSRLDFLPDLGLSFFGLVSAACFFFPGLKYYRRRRRARGHHRGPGPT